MYDVIVIGGGMSGMTAALYALRSSKKVLVLEKESIGGQIAMSPVVRNFPTIQEISGAELSNRLFEQIEALGVDFEVDEATKLEKKDNTFIVTTNYNTFEAKSVIIAGGVAPRKLGLEREEELIGKGIYFCALCDGPLFEGKDVVIIGDANTAMQYALMLAGYCKTVTMVTLFDKFFGEQRLMEAVNNTENIKVIRTSKAVKFLGQDSLSGIIFEKEDGSTFTIETEGVFVAIGQVPQNEIYREFVTLDKAGYIVSNDKCETETAGLFVCGDCRVKPVRQLATAVGDGAIAGTSAISYLETLGK